MSLLRDRIQAAVRQLAKQQPQPKLAQRPSTNSHAS